MTRARRTLVDPETTLYYHCIYEIDDGVLVVVVVKVGQRPKVKSRRGRPDGESARHH